MAIPGENFVLRLREKDGTLIRMNVLDLAVTGPAERVALVEWAYGRFTTADTAGFTILRFDPLGNVLGQMSKTLCFISGIECGNFQLETGYLAPVVDGFILAGTATNINTGAQYPIALRIDNAGSVRWAHRYVADYPHPTTAKITSIVPLETPNRYLISAINPIDDDSWLFQIDAATGYIADATFMSSTRIRRLRRTSIGVLAVGERIASPGMLIAPIILALDTMSAAPLWLRVFRWEREGPDFGVRWFDIAEGSAVLLVVGNVVGHINEVSPMMAFLDKESLPTPADIIKAIEPKLGDDAVRLRAVINHQDLVVPLKGDDVYSAFCVTGDVNKQPWSLAIAEDQTLLWQKKLRIPAASEGREVPVVWASFEEIISGGFVTTSSTPRGWYSRHSCCTFGIE